MTVKGLTIILAALIFIGVIELIRQEKLTFKYAAGWLFVSLAASICAVYDELLSRVAHALGFELTSNFIFFVSLAAFVGLSLLLTVFLCQQSQRNETLAQQIGLLEIKIKKI